MAAVPDYFASSLHMPLKNLAHMPKKFYLDLPGAGEMMVSLANVSQVAEQRFEEDSRVWDGVLAICAHTTLRGCVS